MAAARAIMDHPRVRICDFEAQAGTGFTAETIAALQTIVPQARFVWLMGADNLAQFHLWKDWQEIMERVPVGVLARPGERTAARSAKAARVFRAARLHPRQAQMLRHRQAPAWSFVNMPMQDISSTEIRDSGGWPKV